MKDLIQRGLTMVTGKTPEQRAEIVTVNAELKDLQSRLRSLAMSRQPVQPGSISGMHSDFDTSYPTHGDTLMQEHHALMSVFTDPDEHVRAAATALNEQIQQKMTRLTELGQKKK